MHSARRRLAFLSAAIAALAAVLALILPAAAAPAAAVSAAGNRVGASHPQTTLPVRASLPVSAGEGRCGPAPRPRFAAGACVAAEEGSQVLLDTSAVRARAAAVSLLKPGECAVICSTVEREAAEKGFSAAGLPVIDDGVSAVLRGQVATQLRAFGAAAQGFDNDVVIGATALERGLPLITGDSDLASAVMKLGGEVRWFGPGS